jgi:16S rRNA C1402 N4-methylase RsmH
MNGKFSDLSQLLKENGVKENSIDAALMDCGVSSIQFDMADRGFSVSKDGPLDMRMASNM